MSSSALVEGHPIAGVELIKLDPKEDLRGIFTEVFKNGWNTNLDPVQFSVVHSNKGVMRGCHLHWNHDEYICILKGSASVGLRDERPDSQSRNVWSLYFLCEEEPAALVFPRGLVHGWYFHENSIHLQAVSEAYDDYANYDNHRIKWCDPELQIPWPVSKAVMTEQAENAQSLENVRATLLEKL